MREAVWLWTEALSASSSSSQPPRLIHVAGYGTNRPPSSVHCRDCLSESSFTSTTSRRGPVFRRRRPGPHRARLADLAGVDRPELRETTLGPARDGAPSPLPSPGPESDLLPATCSRALKAGIAGASPGACSEHCSGECSEHSSHRDSAAHFALAEASSRCCERSRLIRRSFG